MDKMQLGAIYGWKYEANIITLFFFRNLSLIVVFGIFICNYKIFATFSTNA